MRDLDAIIPLLGKEQLFREWNEGNPYPIDWESYQLIVARVEQAVFWSEMFAPNFIEINGLVLRLDNLPNDPDEWINGYRNLSATQIEALHNHIHVQELFRHDPETNNYDLEVFVYIAERMAQGWRGQLKVLFPDKELEVIVSGRDGDPQVYAITVRGDD